MCEVVNFNDNINRVDVRTHIRSNEHVKSKLAKKQQKHSFLFKSVFPKAHNFVLSRGNVLSYTFF